jgi:ABC-type uncharacterized transport system permease subunit
MAAENTKCIGTIALKLRRKAIHVRMIINQFMFNFYHIKLFLFMYIINTQKKKKKGSNTTLEMYARVTHNNYSKQQRSAHKVYRDSLKVVHSLIN